VVLYCMLLDSVNLSITLHSLDGQELLVYAHK